MARDVEVDILATDKTAKATKTAARSFAQLKGRVDQATKSSGSASKVGGKLATVMTTVARTTAKAASSVAAVASATGPATVGLLAAGKGAVAFGKGLAGLAPLAAFLPSIGAAVSLVKGTIVLAGPAMAKAMAPVTKAFSTTEGQVGSITKKVQDLASKGLEPLAQKFAAVNLPSIGKGMERIASSTNRVVVGVGKWLNSIEGQKLIASTTDATATATEKLAPKVEAAAIAVGKLAGRAGSKGITGFADLIGRILGKFTEWANNTSVKDIQDSIKDLSGYFDRLRTAWNAIRDIGAWMGENEGKVRDFANAVGGLGLALGVLSGNPFAVIVAGFSLLITNWETVKSTFNRAKAWWSGVWNSIKNDKNIQGVWSSIKAAFQGFIDSFRKGIGDMGPKFREWITQIKAAWQQWAPIIKAWWDGIGKPALSALGTVLAWVAMKALEWGTKTSAASAVIAGAFRILVPKILNLLGTIVNGAAAAFGWMPGIGPKLTRAAADFNAFKNRVNAALDGIEDENVKVRVTMSVSDQAARALRGTPYGVTMAAESTWYPARVAAQFAGGSNFAMAGGGGGTSRTGGPVEVASNVSVNLDGKPFRAMTVKAVNHSERRTAWRTKVGKR